MTDIRKGCRIGLDLGQARIGVAKTDIDGIMAVPVGVIRRYESNEDGIKTIVKYVRKFNAFEIVVGYPVLLSGKQGTSAKSAKKYAIKLKEALPELSVRLVDERLTTVSAHASLLEAGKRRNTHKSIIDQVAATYILENALEYEKKNNQPAGIEIYL